MKCDEEVDETLGIDKISFILAGGLLATFFILSLLFTP